MNSIKRFFSLIPGLRTIYDAAEQVAAVIGNEKNSFFRNPVLVEYPSKGIWAVAFNTGKIKTPLSKGGTQYTVFIPTTPNPTSGFLAVVDRKKTVKLDISAENAVKLILTGGIIKKE